jgi:hypothetical protein
LVVGDVVIALPDASAEPVSRFNFGGGGRWGVVFGEDFQESGLRSGDPGLECDFFDVGENNVDWPMRVVVFAGVAFALETLVCGGDVDVFGRVFAVGFDGTAETVGGGAGTGRFAGFGEVLETTGRGDARRQVRF